MRRLAVALIALAALVAVPSALAAKPAVKPSYLFAMTSTGGALKHDASGWWVELTGTSPLVTRFSDRPNRLASTLTPTQFAAQWRTYGFPSDPPNAALVLDGRPADADVFVVELRHPSVSGTTVRFRARPVRDTSSALARYAKRGDRLRETRFGNASLFIDDGAGMQYQILTVQVQNLAAGAPLTLSVAGSTTQPVTFTTGPSWNPNAGMSLYTNPYLGLVDMQLSGSSISLATTSGAGGAASFQITIYLAAQEGAEGFTLTATNGWGSTIIVTTPSSSGPITQQVIPSVPAQFPWADAGL